MKKTKIKGTTHPAKRQSRQMSEMRKKKSTKKLVVRSDKEDLKGLLTTKLALTRQQFRTIRELYFEHSPDQINKVLRTAQRMGVPDLGNSDLVGNGRRGVQGLINRYRWDEKRHAMEQRLRDEETIADRRPGKRDAASGVGDKSVPAPTVSFP